MTSPKEIDAMLAGMEQRVKTDVRQLNTALTDACNLLKAVQRTRRKVYELNRSTMPLPERNAAVAQALEKIQNAAAKARVAGDVA